MKRKTKRFAEAGSVGGYGRFTEDSPKSVEDMKSGLAAGAPSDEPEVRSFSTTGPEEPKPKPKPKRPKAKVKTGSGASGFGIDEKAMAERGYEANRSKSSDVMSNEEYIKRHQFGTSGGRLTPEQSIKKAQGMKKGGKTASARADGIAQRGKTRA
jgi:hypothetical protein